MIQVMQLRTPEGLSLRGWTTRAARVRIRKSREPWAALCENQGLNSYNEATARRFVPFLHTEIQYRAT